MILRRDALEEGGRLPRNLLTHSLMTIVLPRPNLSRSLTRALLNICHHELACMIYLKKTQCARQVDRDHVPGFGHVQFCNAAW